MDNVLDGSQGIQIGGKEMMIMTGRTHLLIGLSTGIAIAAHAPADHLLRAGVVVVAVIAALLPDIDHPKAIVSGYLPGVGHAARLLVSHRGATHTAIFAAAIMALLLLVAAPTPIVLAAGAGIVSHLVADMLTPGGVPLFIPITRRAFMLAPRPILAVTDWILEALATVGSMVLIVLVVLEKI